MEKQILRDEYKTIRKNIKFKKLKDFMIFLKVITNKKVRNCKGILIYVSKQNEVDTKRLIKYFLKRKHVAVPKIENGEMNFYYIKNLGELKLGFFNILEPVTNNIVSSYSSCVCITPGICFDKKGFRIGYGKGFYDKFFSKNEVYKIGLCYRECLVDKIEHEKHDLGVDKIIFL